MDACTGAGHAGLMLRRPSILPVIILTADGTLVGLLIALHPSWQAISITVAVVTNAAAGLLAYTAGRRNAARSDHAEAARSRDDAVIRGIGDGEYIYAVRGSRIFDGLPGSDSRRQTEAVQQAVRNILRKGFLIFAPPAQMTQGHSERLDVGIAREEQYLDQLVTEMRPHAGAHAERIKTGAHMDITLKGAAFRIDPLSPPLQMIHDTARWQYDVTPLRHGAQTLTLTASIIVDLSFPAGIISIPVFDRDIQVKISPAYIGRKFATANWQWLAGTLAAAITAWITLLKLLKL